MKPHEELLAASTDEHTAARLLGCDPAFVRMWRPRKRELPDGRTIIEPGWEPSGGFIAAALAILRSHRPSFS